MSNIHYQEVKIVSYQYLDTPLHAVFTTFYNLYYIYIVINLSCECEYTIPFTVICKFYNHGK